MEISDLFGRIILSTQINSGNDLICLGTTTGPLYLTWEGCFLAHVSGANNLIGATILKAENNEWQSESPVQETYSDVVECMGTTIQTTKGTATFESRLEHNGYYSGYIKISKKSSDDGSTYESSDMRELVDF